MGFQIIVLAFTFLVFPVIYYNYRRKWRRKRAKDIEFFWDRYYWEEFDTHGIRVITPFMEYDLYKWSIGSNNVKNMGQIFGEIFNNHNLAQIVVEGQHFPTKEFIYNDGIRIFQNRIQYNGGILINTPETIRNDSINKTTTNDLDVFLILDGNKTLSQNEIESLKANLDIIEHGLGFKEGF
ncbi:MAG: hypothetical protein ABIJ45_06140, partial [Candidatus Zixiibacteriota bacterium]